MIDALAVVMEDIPRDECLALLRQLSVGRVAVSGRAGSPFVVPVNYAIDGETIVFRSDGGRRLRDLVDHPVSFEVDLVDPMHRTGWSVLVEGLAFASERPVDGVVVDPWAPGPKSHWVRIVAGSVTGRRIRRVGPGSDPRAYV
jgi:uncharacterized protein